MENKNYYITTPIYYPNGKFHIGTAYTTILADMITRYKKQRGFDTFFTTGLDEHGQKIQEAAEKAGKDPQEFVDGMAEYAKDIWEKLDIDYDYFVRTTNNTHEEIVQKLFTKFLENGDIYKGEYEGYYCVSCETFFTKTQLEDGKCPDCGKDVRLMKEETYFFNMKKYEKRLLEYYEEHPEFIVPEARKNELVNSFLKPGLEDLSITRTSFNWGVKVPGDEKHVIYVWLDALANYITSLGYMTENDEMFKKYWPCDVHIVGKDIIRFHAIYWPIFLMALDIPLPKQIFAHTWFVMKDGKMSKSKGNVIYPTQITEKYGVDVLRYILLRELPYNHDGVFSPEGFVERYNTDLCNDFSNLIHRTIGMIKKYDLSISKEKSEKRLQEGKYIISQIDKNLISNISGIIFDFEDLMDEFKISEAIEKLWTGISRINKYIDERKPWELYKEGNKDELYTFSYVLVSEIKKMNMYIMPIVPETYNIVNEIFNFKEEDLKFERDNTILNPIEIMPNLDAKPIYNRLDETDVKYLQDIISSNANNG